MRELLTKEQLQTIFNYLRNYSDSQAWKDVEEYCYSLKTLRMNGAFNRKDKEGVQLVLNALEANIGSLSEFCQKNNMSMFSFIDDSSRIISQPIKEEQVIEEKKEEEKELEVEENEVELKTIYYGTYEGFNESVGIFREREELTDICVKEYTLYVDYKGEKSNVITIDGYNVDGSSCEFKINVDGSGKYIVETNEVLKNISKMVCEHSESILCEVYAIYKIDVKE